MVPAIFLLWAVCAALGGWEPSVGAAEGKTAGGEAKLIEKFTLGNGLTVVLRENHSSPVVAVQVWVKAGSRNNFV